jgi:hypothetical protein
MAIVAAPAVVSGTVESFIIAFYLRMPLQHADRRRPPVSLREQAAGILA